MLGQFEVTVGRRVVPASSWRLRTSATLVKLLALAPNYQLHREQLMDALWPDAEQVAATRNLRYSLFTARKLISEADSIAPLLQRKGNLITLGPPDLIWTDVDAFTEAVAAAWRGSDPELYERAFSLYAGDLLPDDLYDDGVAGRRASLRASYLTVLSRLAELYRNRREIDRAIETLQRLVEVEPVDEAAHVRLMRLYAHTDRRSLALAQYDQLRSILERELGVAPDAVTCELAETIRRGELLESVLPTGQVELSRPFVEMAARSNLPRPLDDLIGREQEIAELRQLIRRSRLLTLVGPSGIGKTRLAIALAHAVSTSFADGVLFISLASIADARHVIPVIAQALGLREAGRMPLSERVISELRHRCMLLVLDNVEQVSQVGTQFTQILSASPSLHMLLTSRTRLRLRGEQEFPVPPLRHPDAQTVASVATLASCPAVSLFIQRAREVDPQLRLTDTNLTAIAEISRRLAGMPLAIELAAARSAVLTPSETLARLDRPLALLSHGRRDAPERQQTLESAIRWSYDLLDENQQRLFRRLSAFAGGWELESASVVDRVDDDANLDAMTALVDASLILSDVDDSAEARRFRMLEPIRAFAAHLLDESGETDAVRERYAKYFAELVEQVDARLEGPRSDRWLRHVVVEQDNFRTALQWSIDTGNVDFGLRIASSLWEFWSVHGNIGEGRQWLGELLTISEENATSARAEALRGAAELARRQGDYDDAALLLDRSLELWTFLESDIGRARTLNSMGILDLERSDNEAARTHWEQSLALAERAGDAASAVRAQHNLGGLALNLGNIDEAVSRLEAVLTEQRRINNHRGTAFTLSNLGVAARAQGNYRRARDILQESLTLFFGLADEPQISHTFKNLGHVALCCNDPTSAQHYYQESATRSKSMGEIPELVDLIRHVGELEATFGRPKVAARLFGAAEALREALGFPLESERLRSEYEHAVDLLTAKLDATALFDAWEEGRRCTFDEAFDLALEMLRRPLSKTNVPGPGCGSRDSGDISRADSRPVRSTQDLADGQIATR